MKGEEKMIGITCNKCNEELNKSHSQDEDELTRFECNCGTDIYISDEDLMRIDFAEWMRKYHYVDFDRILYEMVRSDEQK